MATATPQKRRYRMSARAQAAAATRERLLDASWRQFAERSFDGVRLSEVASEAGVSVQTLHAHFGTKEELFVAAWQWHQTPVGALRDQAPVGDLRAAVRLIYDSYERDGDGVLRLLAQEERKPAGAQRGAARRR